MMKMRNRLLQAHEGAQARGGRMNRRNDRQLPAPPQSVSEGRTDKNGRQRTKPMEKKTKPMEKKRESRHKRKRTEHQNVSDSDEPCPDRRSTISFNIVQGYLDNWTFFRVQTALIRQSTCLISAVLSFCSDRAHVSGPTHDKEHTDSKFVLDIDPVRVFAFITARSSSHPFPLPTYLGLPFLPFSFSFFLPSFPPYSHPSIFPSWSPSFHALFSHFLSS